MQEISENKETLKNQSPVQAQAMKYAWTKETGDEEICTEKGIYGKGNLCGKGKMRERKMLQGKTVAQV